MEKMRLYLFRVKVFPPKQVSLLEPDLKRDEILSNAIDATPSYSSSRGGVWHIGNVEHLNGGAIYFRIGRTTRSVAGLFDEDAKEFQDRELEDAPYTHALLDVKYQVCAIAPNSKLVPNWRLVGKRLERLLEQTTGLHRATFEVDDIPDPTNFIEEIEGAYSVTRFGIEFGRPNIFDADEDFQKPAQRLLASAQGVGGKTEIYSDTDLDRSVLSALARAAARAGNKAFALLKVNAEAAKVRKETSGTSTSIAIDTLDSKEEKEMAISRMIEEYRQIVKSNGP